MAEVLSVRTMAEQTVNRGTLTLDQNGKLQRLLNIPMAQWTFDDVVFIKEIYEQHSGIRENIPNEYDDVKEFKPNQRVDASITQPDKPIG